jgi:hypothetical protein
MNTFLRFPSGDRRRVTIGARRMAKININDITGLGIIKEMYSAIAPTEAEFENLIGEIISEQSAILEGRIGSDVYASVIQPTAGYVKRAEKCLVAAEMVQRRINIILGNAVGAGQEINISHEAAQKKAYSDEAEKWITKLGDGDYSGGVAESSHFRHHHHGVHDV